MCTSCFKRLRFLTTTLFGCCAQTHGGVKPRLTHYIETAKHDEKHYVHSDAWASSYDVKEADYGGPRLTLMNNALEVYMSDNATECPVSWTEGIEEGIECADTVDKVMSILMHAEHEEAVAVTREVIEVGGSSAAMSVSAWCDMHPEAELSKTLAAEVLKIAEEDVEYRETMSNIVKLTEWGESKQGATEDEPFSLTHD